MAKHNPANERIKREYFTFLKEAKRQTEASIDGVAQALARFEASTGYRDFKAFHHQQAISFKRNLAERVSVVTGAKLSKATIYAISMALKRFFQWLAGQPGYKSRLKYSDAEFFNPSDKDARIATARRERSFPTLEQVKHVVAAMPSDTEIQCRDRAVVAFTLVTGARDSAIASMSLKHVDLVAGCVYQDARDVKTKFSKTFTTAFFPVGDEIVRLVTDWVNYLRQENLWGNDDPLFPATKVIVGDDNRFQVAGLERKHWSNATAIRKIFRAAFTAVGLPYFHPHSLRNTLVHLGESLCQTPEEFKAWSQNHGHEKVLTTFCSYGQVATARQAEIIRDLGKPRQLATDGTRASMTAIVREVLEAQRLEAAKNRIVEIGFSKTDRQ